MSAISSQDSSCFLVDPPPSLLPENYHEWVYSQHQSALDSTPVDELRTVEISKSKYAKVSTSSEATDSYSQMSLKDLRTECRQKNLKITGKRAELEDRLRKATAGGAILNPISESGETTSP
jgi:hypothetical protein